MGHGSWRRLANAATVRVIEGVPAARGGVQALEAQGKRIPIKINEL
jgi:hypothetical protein